MKRPYAECSEKKLKQRWYQCVTCGLYGSEKIGICKACAMTCHQEHTLLDLGVRKGKCYCANANCTFRDE